MNIFKRSVSTEHFFNDLEKVLDKHLGSDWEWTFDGDKPLTIYSGKLYEMWEKEQVIGYVE